jgi:hypothetical protein
MPGWRTPCAAGLRDDSRVARRKELCDELDALVLTIVNGDECERYRHSAKS